MVSEDVWVLRHFNAAEVVAAITVDVHGVIDLTIVIINILLVLDDEVLHVLF